MANFIKSTLDNSPGFFGASGSGSSTDPFKPEVMLADQTTPVIITPFKSPVVSTTVAVQPTILDYTVEVASGTSIAAGQWMVLFNADEVRFSQAQVVGVSGTTVTMDRPIDFAYPVGSPVDFSTTDMSIDGSTTPVDFAVRGGTPVPQAVQASVDITRIIVTMITTTTPTLPEFGDITALTRGLNMCHHNGLVQNILNFKSNQELANMCYDLQLLNAIGTGNNGIIARITFAGQNKMGVAIRLGPGEDLHFRVQDNLSGLLNLSVMAEGHIVE